MNLKLVPAGSYMFKVNHRNTGTRCEICSKLTLKTPERRRRSVVFIDNFEHISHLCSSVSIVNFEQVNATWEVKFSPVWENLVKSIKQYVNHANSVVR